MSYEKIKQRILEAPENERNAEAAALVIEKLSLLLTKQVETNMLLTQLLNKK